MELVYYTQAVDYSVITSMFMPILISALAFAIIGWLLRGVLPEEVKTMSYMPGLIATGVALGAVL